MTTIESAQVVVIRFLSELCARNNPVIVNDSDVFVPLPSSATFVLDFSQVISGESASRGIKQTSRRSNRHHHADVEGVISVFRKWVHLGLHLLKRVLADYHLSQKEVGLEREAVLMGLEEERVLECLWCVLVCVQHTRYNSLI